MTEQPRLERDGPVVLIQSETDPGDIGEPREWATDGVTYLVVPSFDLWPSDGVDPVPAGERLSRAAEAMAVEAELVLAGINDLHRMRGRMSKVTANDVALLLAAARRAG